MSIRTEADIQTDREALRERLLPNLRKQKPNGTTHMRWDDIATLLEVDIVALQEEAGVIHVESVEDAEISADERMKAAEERLNRAKQIEAEAATLEEKVVSKNTKRSVPTPQAATRKTREQAVERAKEDLIDEE